jgi:hypothetical protein
MVAETTPLRPPKTKSFASVCFPNGPVDRFLHQLSQMTSVTEMEMEMRRLRIMGCRPPLVVATA